MSSLTEGFTYAGPVPVTDEDKNIVDYLVYICYNGLATGECGHGDTPEAAMEDAKQKVASGSTGW